MHLSIGLRIPVFESPPSTQSAPFEACKSEGPISRNTRTYETQPGAQAIPPMLLTYILTCSSYTSREPTVFHAGDFAEYIKETDPSVNLGLVSLQSRRIWLISAWQWKIPLSSYNLSSKNIRPTLIVHWSQLYYIVSSDPNTLRSGKTTGLDRRLSSGKPRGICLTFMEQNTCCDY